MALPQLEKIAAAQGFKGEAGQIIAASMVGEDRESVRRVIVVGLGAEDELCLEGVRKALGSGLKEAEKLKVEVLTAAPRVWKRLPVADVARAMAETAKISGYRFDRYLSEKKKKRA